MVRKGKQKRKLKFKGQIDSQIVQTDQLDETMIVLLFDLDWCENKWQNKK